MDRRRFLKIAGIGAAGAATGIGTLRKCHSDKKAHFEELWKLWHEYLKYFNECNSLKLNVTKAFSDEDRLAAAACFREREVWSLLNHYNNENLREIDFRSSRNHQIRSWLEKYGKYYDKSPSFASPKVSNLMLGGIVDFDLEKSELEDKFNKRKGTYRFRWEGYNPHGIGQDLDYRVILFNQEGETLDEIMKSGSRTACWDKHNSTAYINLTSIERTGDYLYDIGSSLARPNRQDEILDIISNKNKFENLDEGRKNFWFKLYMISELYQLVQPESKEIYPIVSMKDPEKAWKDTYLDIIIKICVEHEKMHNWFPYPDDPEEAKKAMKNEKETVFYEAQTRFNSDTFAKIASRFGEEYYADFWAEMPSKYELMNMSPEQRADMFRELLPNNRL